MKKTIKSILNFFTKWFKQYEISWLDNSPLVLQYENKTNEDKTAIIFGFNEFANEDCYGNKGIEVKNLQVGVDNPKGYARAFYQSANKPFDIGKIRVMSPILLEKYKNLIFTRKKCDANGTEYTVPYRMFSYYDKAQVQQDIIDMDFMLRGHKISIDASTYIEFKLLANTRLVLLIFPKKSLTCGYFGIKINLKMHDKSVVNEVENIKFHKISWSYE
jgi:hypothetical protein